MSLINGRLEVSGELETISRSQVASRINKVARAARSDGIAKMRETYNISRNSLSPYLVLNRASPSKLEASLRFKIKAVPIEAFKPRVQMRPTTIKTRRGTRVQRLPYILLNRYVGKAPKVIPGAFPLKQRTSGPLRSGEKVRRRTSHKRGKLTRLRYYVFPERFLFGELLPYLRTRANGALVENFRYVVRTRTGRGFRELRAGVAPTTTED